MEKDQSPEIVILLIKKKITMKLIGVNVQSRNKKSQIKQSLMRKATKYSLYIYTNNLYIDDIREYKIYKLHEYL